MQAKQEKKHGRSYKYLTADEREKIAIRLEAGECPSLHFAQYIVLSG